MYTSEPITSYCYICVRMVNDGIVVHVRLCGSCQWPMSARLPQYLPPLWDSLYSLAKQNKYSPCSPCLSLHHKTCSSMGQSALFSVVQGRQMQMESLWPAFQAQHQGQWANIDSILPHRAAFTVHLGHVLNQMQQNTFASNAPKVSKQNYKYHTNFILRHIQAINPLPAYILLMVLRIS